MGRNRSLRRPQDVRRRAEERGYTHRPELAGGLPCPYCNQVMIAHIVGKKITAATVTRDHVIPRSLGGKSVLVVCNECNGEKGDLDPEEWITYLLIRGRTSWARRSLRIFQRMYILPPLLRLEDIVVPSLVNENSSETAPPPAPQENIDDLSV